MHLRMQRPVGRSRRPEAGDSQVPLLSRGGLQHGLQRGPEGGGPTTLARKPLVSWFSTPGFCVTQGAHDVGRAHRSPSAYILHPLTSPGSSSPVAEKELTTADLLPARGIQKCSLNRFDSFSAAGHTNTERTPRGEGRVDRDERTNPPVPALGQEYLIYPAVGLGQTAFSPNCCSCLSHCTELDNKKCSLCSHVLALGLPLSCVCGRSGIM